MITLYGGALRRISALLTLCRKTVQFEVNGDDDDYVLPREILRYGGFSIYVRYCISQL